MNEYEQVNGLWLPKYVQRNGVWVKREQATEPTPSLYDSLRVAKAGPPERPVYFFLGGVVRGFLEYQETPGEAAVSEAEAILRGDS